MPADHVPGGPPAAGPRSAAPVARPATRALAARRPGERVARIRLTSTEVTVRARPRTGPGERGAPAEDLDASMARAIEIVQEVARTCSRVDPESPLALVNAEPSRWHVVPDLLLAVLVEGDRAYRRTSGRVDPRVPQPAAPSVAAPSVAADPGRLPGTPWRLQVRQAHRAVHLGGTPVELDGVALGLALRWASAELGQATRDFLVTAGSVAFGSGDGPDGTPWRIEVDDPRDEGSPLLRVSVAGRAAATTARRARRAGADGRPVQEVADPVTGRDGGEGLVSATVVDADPSYASTWSTALYLAGAPEIEAVAGRAQLAALWVSSDGSWSHTAPVAPFLDKVRP